MVRTKPSKQPLGLVARGVPIEKVSPKAMWHSEWECGAAGSPKGCLGRSNFGQGHVFMVQNFEKENREDLTNIDAQEYKALSSENESDKRSGQLRKAYCNGDNWE